MTEHSEIRQQAPPEATIEFLNIDGAVAGQAVIEWNWEVEEGDAWREALERTLSRGYEARVILPPPEHADPRCPYSLRFRLT